MREIAGVTPDALSAEDLDVLARALDRMPAGSGQTPQLVGPNGASVELPASIHKLLESVVDMLKRGDRVSIVPLHAELTTVQAAEVLNVSRPHLIKQVKTGALPYHMVGTHRRLRLLDVLAYRDHLDNQASDALSATADEAEDLGLHD